MATVELQYDTWDNTTESFNELDLSGVVRGGRDYPFRPSQVMTLMFQEEHFYHLPHIPEYKEAVRQMTALLHHNLVWFRRLGVSAEALKTLVKDYPGTDRGARYAVLDDDDLRDAMDYGKDFTISVPSP